MPDNRISSRFITQTINQLSLASDSQQIQNIATEIKQEVCADYICCGIFLTHNYIEEIVFLISDAPQEWQDEYHNGNLIKIDERLIKARKQTLPFSWDQIDTPSEQQSVISRAKEFNIEYGLTCPVHLSKNRFGFVHLLYKAKPKKTRSRMEYLFPYMHILACSLIENFFINILSQVQAKSSLTQRERESLCWLANGKTSEEIATIMNISKSTVSKNVEEIFLKLNCSKRSQAIAIASNENLFAMQYKKKSRIVYLCE